MKNQLLLSLIILLGACTSEPASKDKYVLQPTDQYLAYEIDEETRVPLYHSYTFKTEHDDWLVSKNLNYKRNKSI